MRLINISTADISMCVRFSVTIVAIYSLTKALIQ